VCENPTRGLPVVNPTHGPGRTGPPQELNEVSVEPPSGSLLPHEIDLLNQTLQLWMHGMEDSDVIALWAHALGNARAINGRLF